MKQVNHKSGGALLFVGLAIGMMMAGLAVAGTGDIDKGKTLYRQSCGHCHGLNGNGDGELGRYTNPPPANLNSQKTQSQSDAELKEVIMNGRPGTSMVGFKDAIVEEQFNDLFAYLRSLKP